MAKANKGMKGAAASTGKRDELPPHIAANVKLPEGFKVKRQITVPSLVLKEVGKPHILKIMDRMRISTYVDPDPKKKKEKPATICAVTNMETGEVAQLLVPSVMEANLRRDYDAMVKVEGEGKETRIVEDNGAHTYVDKVFRVENLGKRPGKRYFDFSIFEVEAE